MKPKIQTRQNEKGDKYRTRKFKNNQITEVDRNPDMCEASEWNVKQKDEEYCS